MADGQGPLRLTAPSRQAYETSPGEQTVLRGLNENNLGALYGVLLNQQALGQSAARDYSRDLAAVNAQQAGLGRAHLANENLQDQRKTALGLVQHGGLPVSVALNAMDLSGLPGFLSQRDAALQTIGSDQRQADLTSATAFQRANEGAYAGVQAGLNPNQGQAVPPGAAGTVGLGRTVGSPLNLSVADLRARAQVASSGARSPARVIAEWDEASQMYKYRVVGTDADAVTGTARRLQSINDEDNQREVEAAGGNIRPTGANSPDRGAGTSRIPSPPAANPRVQSPPRGGALTADESAKIARMTPRVGQATQFERTGDGRLYIRTPSGRHEVK